MKFMSAISSELLSDPITLSVDIVYIHEQDGKYAGKGVLSAVRIHRAKVVDCPRYLRGLWDMLLTSNIAQSGSGRVTWVKEAVTSSSRVEKLSEEFDAVILSCGASLPKLSPQQLDVKLVRGQNVYITPVQRWEGSNPIPLRDALLFGEYIVPKTSSAGFRNSSSSIG
jgi:glycine/D-amino acid oxidase-like deaminating enzyme